MPYALRHRFGYACGMTASPEVSALPAARDAVSAIIDDTVALRRDLHEHAELSTEEHRTQGVIVERLRAAGLDDVRAIADTGVTAIVRGGRPGPNLLWRADIDGLPLIEETGLPFASREKAMHACGHDGHVAIALAMADLLQRSRDSLAGTVRFAFQPAEEHVGGAARMIAQGVLDEPRVDQLFGLHIWASAPVGHVLVREGAIFAAATHFRIIIRGRGGHAAAPHETIDPIVVAAQAVTALQTVVSRTVDAQDRAVLTIGRIEGGVRGNIIPNEVMMSGTIRTFEPRVLDRMLRRIDQILGGVTSAWGAEHQFDHSTLGACVNDSGCAAIVERVAVDFVGPERVRETQATGADDMCRFLEERPGAYFLLGGALANAERVYPHHHPKFDFDERCLPLGIEMGLRIIEDVTGSRIA
jgi:amidohydrolase